MKVLLGIGGSEDSLAALERMIERAERSGDELTVAIVDNPDTDPTPSNVEDRVESALAAADIDPVVRRVTGDPGSRLVEIAETESFDAIALGGGTESPMGKIRLGHIAEFVILNANVTVILVR
ncbi:MAG: universal stress protein [Halobacteriales archaeon]|nr:universal stress protein [Halobacteriales archaeon]